MEWAARSRRRSGSGVQSLPSDVSFGDPINGIHVYTDGSFDPLSGRGGWAFVVMENGAEIHDEHGRQTGTGNNGFEVLAMVKALVWIESTAAARDVVLWTDSFHVMDGCHRWRKIWRTNGWKRINANVHARRRRIPDVDIWRQLDALLERNLNVHLKWCKGHAATPGNVRADILARAVVQEPAD
jgi:ribonuclease HI